MSRIRISTTVDECLLEQARSTSSWQSAAEMVDAAMQSLVAAHQETQIDDAYQAYEECPVDAPDAWGRLSDFHRDVSAISA